MDGLRANFDGECSEVGMYLAMARVAEREGYPEIAEAYKRYAYEEADHASRFAELLGEVVTDSTKKNLMMRAEAECGACAGKMDLAKKAKALNLDAIHDTVHEMAKDEARHGRGFDDPARAAMLALIQMLCCLGLVLLSQRLSKAVAIGVSHVRGWRDPDDRLHSRLSDGLLIGAALLLLLPPLLAVIVDGINRNMLDVLAQPALWQALSTSLRIAIAAGLLSVTLTIMLLWSSRELRARQRPLAGQAMELSGMLILAMPGIVLATGFFLLLNNTIGLPESADGIVIFTNALMAIPYALKVLQFRSLGNH